MSERNERFRRLMLPHLDGAYRLAVWVLRDAALAEEAVQEACLRALRFLDSLRGEQGRPWLLGIVRNVCRDILQRERGVAGESFDEASHGEDSLAAGSVVRFPLNPEAAAIASAERAAVQEALRGLPLIFREVLVLRELEELSYREIAEVTGTPIGTVMSRLARARRQMMQILAESRREAETGIQR